MNTSYEAFLPYVLPMVPHAPEPSAIIAIRNACIDFCRGSLFLEYQMDPISVAAGIADYEIDVPAGTALTQVLTLYYCGSRLSRRTLSELSSMYSRDWMLMTGTPKAWTQMNPKEVKLVLTPADSVADALTGSIAVCPTRASTSVDSQVFERYVEQIARGAASKMFNIPNEPFSSPEQAMLYSRQFIADIANARAAVNAGQTRAPMKVRFTRT